ncbi:S-adenosyl-L-methionine-dependent methyltransferase [Gonapodya prolifera JEL478]|uniref:Trimethylguanosine synthase n=1 Tax=Gonapodya prolifera (strain JEL478) TaxID=1344416 RepID=A0A139ASL5_GONPJ|nr:S-adenosyl-L-methionine-dependent methyltransferase [Gonapodya prolifera JEL478]|eukprot:KXS19738.1 S-adenosyl-L-methionine-dependent methyltransferase [Gonapodya prolifera JEL478]
MGKKRRRLYEDSSAEDTSAHVVNGVDKMNWTFESMPPHLKKYWAARYSLWSRYDSGIVMDEEGWYSVTPEAVGRYITDRCAGVIDSRLGEGASLTSTVVDAFCGAGGNAIQFAARFGKVIAIDIDETRLRCAKENARIYGVSDRIEFIHANYLDILPTLNPKPAVIFLSPPWGGPSYRSQATFQLSSIEVAPSKSSSVPVGGYELIQRSLPPQCDMCMFYAPRNSDVAELSTALGNSSDGNSGVGVNVEIERVFLNGRDKVLLGISVRQ